MSCCVVEVGSQLTELENVVTVLIDIAMRDGTNDDV